MRIAVVGTGEMGSAIAGRLHARGAHVVASVAGRSPASVARVRGTGVATLSDDVALVRESDVLLSIVPPGVAVDVAQHFAGIIRQTQTTPIYVDCNAIAPSTMDRVAAAVTAAGARCVDVGIIGFAPKGDDPGPQLYASGDAANELKPLIAWGVQIRVLDGPIGVASRMKMSYAGITKGLTGVAAAMTSAAERNGLGAALRTELSESQATLLPLMERQLAAFPPKAYRWVAEMREIATFLADDPPAAAMYEALAMFYERVAERVAAAEPAKGA